MWLASYVVNWWILFSEWPLAHPSILPKSRLFPSLISKDPQTKTSSLIFINPLQKWESFGLAWTCDRDFVLKYLFRSKDCHVPSLFSKFTIHLLKRHLFWTSRSMTPRPPWSFGRQRMSHLAKWYFFLIWTILPEATRSVVIKFL